MSIPETILHALGEKENVVSVTNCMTRLRFVIKDEKKTDDKLLSETSGVLGVVHDNPLCYEVVVGPGKSRKYADVLHDLGIPSSANGTSEVSSEEWKKNKEKLRDKQKNNKMKSFLKIFGDIFVPLIPGTIAAGLCSGIAMLISQTIPEYTERTGWMLLYQIFSMINISFMTYITAWAGYRAAERFGATPILGGMLGMITSLDGVNTISELLGMFNESAPLNSILRSGRGGVLAAVAGVFVLSYIERKIRKIMPDSVDIVFTPLLSLLICLIPYLFLVMPALGYVSSSICWILGKICISDIGIVRAAAGFISSALFLPMVATGMHHGLVALYTVQLEQFGFVTLYPALAMAGAGQVGASIAILMIAKKEKNIGLVNTIRGVLPAGILGVGEPMIYGVTLPMGKPFITAGIGAGFGGAFVLLFKVASTTWGPSGILGVFVMTAGPNGAVMSICYYAIGLLISCIMGCLITYLAISPSAVSVRKPSESVPDSSVDSSEEDQEVSVHHGEFVLSFVPSNGIRYNVRDRNGIHARPAAALMNISSQFQSRITVSANGRTASADSIIDLMALNVKYGTEITVNAEGTDREIALEKIQTFLLNNL